MRRSIVKIHIVALHYACLDKNYKTYLSWHIKMGVYACDELCTVIKNIACIPSDLESSEFRWQEKLSFQKGSKKRRKMQDRVNE